MVYFAELRNGNQIFIKIGSSDDPKKRIRNLQTASPYPIRLLGFRPGSVIEERIIQRQFKDCLVRGEWYKPHPELLSMIKVMCD